MQFRGTPIRLRLADGRLEVAVDAEGAPRPVKIGAGEEIREVCPGGELLLRARDGLGRG
jgi:hypothetical protein